MTLLRAVLTAVLLAGAGAAPARAGPVRAPHLAAELVSQTDGVAPGSRAFLAVVLTADQGWHTYWRNPGDAGEATEIHWTLPAGWTAGGIVWPAPRRLPAGPLMTYGYPGQVLLAVPIQVPAGVRPGGLAAITARVDYLVCADVQCVPGSATLAIGLPVVAGAPPQNPRWGAPIAAAIANSPKPAGLAAAFQKQGASVRLAVAGTPLDVTNDADAYFYPFDDRFIDQAKPQTIEIGPRGLTLAMTPGPDFAGGASPSRAAGVLEVDGKAFEVDAVQGPPPAGASGLGQPARAGEGLSARLALAIALAFAGGVVLNLMPCVFPILSMKALTLARQGQDARARRREAGAFVAGVLVTFLVLATILIAARTAGAAVGWGFQLQSPTVVGLLALVFLAAALNLSGLYEAGTSIQGLGSGLAGRGGALGSLLTGALAVVVAAPCTAPFMGPALGFALTQSPVVALGVFAALGLGFAAPFAMLSLHPAFSRRLPAPGPWMETTRQILAFPLYASAAWLVWVLAQQAGTEGLARLLAAMVALGAAAWAFGLGQRRRAEARPSRSLLITAGVAAVLAVGLVAGGGVRPASRPGAPSLGASLVSAPFGARALDALRAAGRPVLVNFTAAWCVTCQVNERLALSSPAVAAALRRDNGAYLVADWTNRDAAIASALARQGRVGVPLYLIYGAGGGAPMVLPQILTPAIVVAALDRASVRPPARAAK